MAAPEPAAAAVGEYSDILNPDTFKWHEEVRHDPSLEYKRAYAEVKRLGLESYAAELDSVGYTVLPPDVVGAPDLADRLLDRSLGCVERRYGITIDRTAGIDDWDIDPRAKERANLSSFGLSVGCLVREDPLFEEILLNEVNLALVTYLIGSQAVLYNFNLLVKGPGSPPIDLHSDTFFMPPPWPPYAVLGQSLWVLNDYSEADGATGFVPGSHRLARLPRDGEGTDDIAYIEAPAGSVIVFHGHLWHCAAPRTNTGYRAVIALHFCRHWVQTQNEFRGTIPNHVLEARGPRFRQLLHEAPTLGDPASLPCTPR